MADERLFTLAEARAMLPQVRESVERLEEQRLEVHALRSLLQSVQRAATGDGSSVVTETAQLQRRMSELIDSIRETVATIAKLGVQLKDVERGLVDWQAIHQERRVLICWQRGEDAIEWWHDLEAGFSGRQRIVPEEWD